MFTIHSKPDCKWCLKTKDLLTEEDFSYRDVTYNTPEQIDSFKAQGFKTFPQIYLKDRHIGGYDDLIAYLDELDF